MANRLSRRDFMRASASGTTAAAVTLAASTTVAKVSQPPPIAQATRAWVPSDATVSFDTGWQFGGASITLPHTVTPLDWQNWDAASWEKTWTYTKDFSAPVRAAGTRVFLAFDAAMTTATVTLNGTTVATHAGGYLPLRTEITGHLKSANALSVALNSRFNIDVPPDRPAPYASSSIDFFEPGGLYRDAWLVIVPETFVEDVFAKPVNVLDSSTRQVAVQVTIDAGAKFAGTLRTELLDGDTAVASASTKVSLAKGTHTIALTIKGLKNITLWDTANPKLYTVTTTVGSSTYQTQIGFREATFTKEGFYLNGKRVKLFGVNRHQLFPYTGAAMPARVQARDVTIMKSELNCVMVRTSHYPQSPAFLDACDQQGLLVWEEVPGWGYMGDAAWRAADEQNVQNMIIRDRNHPSIIVWGVQPNEAGEYPAFYTACKQLAHQLDDSRPTGGDGTRTDATYVEDVYSIHDYSSHTTDGVRWPTLQPPTDAAGKPYLVCEAVGALSGPAAHYRRIDTQTVQQDQAIAHAIVHNISYSDDRYCGLLAWSGFDYPSGTLSNAYNGVKCTGVVDLFRELKPGAAIYAAQVHPATRPVIAPAFYWDATVSSLSSAMICSNCDSLSLYVGGKHHATLAPDKSSYGSLPYPPYFADLSSIDLTTKPDLLIDGYVSGRLVASRSFSMDTGSDKLSLRLDDASITGDGSDATRVAFGAVDRYGNTRPYATGSVTFSLTGPATLIGDNPFDLTSAGGTAAAWLRSQPGATGPVTLTATHPALGTAAVTLTVTALPPALVESGS
jgi:beta-galactosidase